MLGGMKFDGILVMCIDCFRLYMLMYREVNAINVSFDQFYPKGGELWWNVFDCCTPIVSS